MTSAEQVRATREKLSTAFRPYETVVVVDFVQSKICLAVQCDEIDVGAVVPAIRACAFAAGAVSVLNSSKWEGSRTCPFVLPSAGGIFVFRPNLCGIQWQIAVYKPHGHDNNWLLYSASQSELQSARRTVKWAAGWAKDKSCFCFQDRGG